MRENLFKNIQSRNSHRYGGNPMESLIVEEFIKTFGENHSVTSHLLKTDTPSREELETLLTVVQWFCSPVGSNFYKEVVSKKESLKKGGGFYEEVFNSVRKLDIKV